MRYLHLLRVVTNIATNATVSGNLEASETTLHDSPQIGSFSSLIKSKRRRIKTIYASLSGFPASLGIKSVDLNGRQILVGAMILQPTLALRFQFQYVNL